MQLLVLMVNEHPCYGGVVAWLVSFCILQVHPTQDRRPAADLHLAQSLRCAGD